MFLNDLLDVDTTGVDDGYFLVFDISQNKYVLTDVLSKQTIDGGFY
jgi:hypothetical protein